MALFHDENHARHNARIYADNCENASKAIDHAVEFIRSGATIDECEVVSTFAALALIAHIAKDAGKEPSKEEAVAIQDEIMNSVIPERLEEVLKDDAVKAVMRYAATLAVRTVTEEDLIGICDGFATCAETADGLSSKVRGRFMTEARAAFVEIFEEHINNELSARGMH